MTRPRLGGCDFEPRVTVDDGSGDSKVVIFFARLFLSLPFCLPGFYLFPSLSLKRTRNYSFGGSSICSFGSAQASAASRSVAHYLIVRDSGAAQWQRHGLCYNFEIKIEKHAILAYRSNGPSCVFAQALAAILGYLSRDGIAV